MGIAGPNAGAGRPDEGWSSDVGMKMAPDCGYSGDSPRKHG